VITELGKICGCPSLKDPKYCKFTVLVLLVYIFSEALAEEMVGAVRSDYKKNISYLLD
jgi:hypothetical protein